MNRLTAMNVFAHVVELQGFTAASDKLGISRAATSKHVQQLEAHLGARLLNRTTRRTSLTEIGTIYYERCKAILADVDEADSCARSSSAEPRGRLRVNAPMSFGTSHLGPAVAAYCRGHPHVQVSLELNDRMVDVVGEGFDVSIRIADLEDSSLIARKIAPCHLVMCAAPDYLDRQGHPNVPQDLAIHQCLVYASAPAGDSWTFYGPDGRETVRVNGPVGANNGDILRIAAIEGLGVARLPTFMVNDDIRDGRLELILTEYELAQIGIYALFPSRRYLSEKVRTFVDFLLNYFANKSDW